MTTKPVCAKLVSMKLPTTWLKNRPSRLAGLVGFSLLILINIVASPLANAQTTNNNNDADLLIILVNLERIMIQLNLSQQSFATGNMDSAFSHIYIPLSTTFQSVKPKLQPFIGEEKTLEFEGALADLPLSIKKGDSAATEQKFASVRQIIDETRAMVEKESGSSKNVLIIQTITVMLRDAEQFYQKQSESPLNLASAYETVVRAESNYLSVADALATDQKLSVQQFFSELKTKVSQKSDLQQVSQLVSAIERDLAESIGLSTNQTANEYAKYFANIDFLYNQLVTEVKGGNYDRADELAGTVYLDNFEPLETPLEKYDSGLMLKLEEMMRIQLRDKIKSKESAAAIESFVNEIKVQLDTAKGYLVPEGSQIEGASPSNDGQTASPLVDTNKLRESLGTYQGDRQQMGDASESAKSLVRSNVDQIRIDLDRVVTIYKQGNIEGALLTARLAYLNSYENVESPLRPINPDFTLEMEIKFAELRNLIQTNAPLEQVEGKVIEIRRGLDESERLVSGPGVMAPAIAFSSSFSIIFREGLEGALIIGAILTYLEASRNEKFKKHVYYGILIAIAATAVTWFIAQFIIQISGASKELIEAIAGVSAVGVLFWVSFWVLNKIETKKWIEFVKAKVWKATTTGSVLVFTMLSFFTIYREGFEVVLFYQAMLSFAKYMEWYVIAGLAAGLSVIAAVTLVVRKMGKRLPLRVLFGLTMGVGAYMSIVFIGNAVREFQEVGYIETTPMIGIIPRLDINLATMTGIHPTLETVVAQLVLLAVYVAGSAYVLFLRPRRQRMIQASRKSRSEII